MQGSLRLRITPTELELLKRRQTVSEALAAAFGWFVSIEPNLNTLLRVDGPNVAVCLSDADVALLAEPEREGVYFATDHDPVIRYFIEKDFPCVHPRPVETCEPQTETFRPPAGFKERHKCA